MEETLRKYFNREVNTLVSLEKQLNNDILEVVTILSKATGNILVTGIGTSATIARRMAHLLGCVGARAYFVHPSDQQHGAIGAIKESDIIIAFSKGGESIEINGLLEIAKQKDCTLISITGNEDSTMSKMVDKQVIVKVPEDSEPFGMIATTSSLAAGLFADMICSLLLEDTGYRKEEFYKTHPGGMVGIKIRNRE